MHDLLLSTSISIHHVNNTRYMSRVGSANVWLTGPLGKDPRVTKNKFPKHYCVAAWNCVKSSHPAAACRCGSVMTQWGDEQSWILDETFKCTNTTNEPGSSIKTDIPQRLLSKEKLLKESCERGSIHGEKDISQLELTWLVVILQYKRFSK